MSQKHLKKNRHLSSACVIRFHWVQSIKKGRGSTPIQCVNFMSILLNSVSVKWNSKNLKDKNNKQTKKLNVCHPKWEIPYVKMSQTVYVSWYIGGDVLKRLDKVIVMLNRLTTETSLVERGGVRTVGDSKKITRVSKLKRFTVYLP